MRREKENGGSMNVIDWGRTISKQARRPRGQRRKVLMGYPKRHKTEKKETV